MPEKENLLGGKVENKKMDRLGCVSGIISSYDFLRLRCVRER